MKNFKIEKDYYSFDNFSGKSREECEKPNGVNTMDAYILAGRSYRALGNDQGLFTNRTYEDVAKNATQAYIDNDGIVRWKSNGRTPFGDMLLDFFLQGHIDEVRKAEAEAVATLAFSDQTARMINILQKNEQ